MTFGRLKDMVIYALMEVVMNGLKQHILHGMCR